MTAPRDQRTLMLGLVITASGLICLGSGIALLIWQVANPEQAAKLPQSIIVTAEPTPTPGILGTEIAPPPLPDDPAQIAILPVSDDPTTTPAITPPDTLPPTAPYTFFPPPRATATAASHTATPPPDPTTPAVSPTALTASPGPPDTPPPADSPTIAPTASETFPPERIIIDRIALNANIVPVGQHAITLGDQVFSQWDVPSQRAAGWHENSSTLGIPGNVVLNGHHNVSGEVFRYLRVLEPGDLITLKSAGRQFDYMVVQTMTLAEQDQPVEVRQQNARWILPTTDERVTLITCWPYTARTHRLVVIARPVKDVIPPANIP